MQEYVKKEMEQPANTPYEDAALKTAMQYFGEEILPRIGVSGVIEAILPTEDIYLELKRLYEDFNYKMRDGSIAHFEFQSRNEGITGLKRFRSYESATSQKFNCAVVTYVVYSGTVKNSVTEFTEGINTYRIQPVILQGENADETIEKIQEKKNLTQEDLVPLLLTPLMSGTISIKERVKTSFRILHQEEALLSIDDMHRMEAVLYALASKLLDKVELEDVKASCIL